MGFLEFCINRPCASKLCQCVPMYSAPLICSLCKALWSLPKATESLANLAHLASGGLRQFCEFCERLSASGGYLVSPQRPLDHGLFKQMQMAHLRMLCLADVWPGHSWSVVAVERCAGRQGLMLTTSEGL